MNAMLLNTITAPFVALSTLTVSKDSGTAPNSFDELDRAIESLAQVTQPSDSVQVGMLLRTYYDNAGDELTVTGDDLSGVRLYDAQVWFDSRVGAYEVFVKLDGGEATAFPQIAGDGVIPIALRDAWVRTHVTDEIQIYLGQYKCPLVSSASVGDGSLAMVDRTRIGQLFSAPGAYQPGVAVTGDFGDFHAKLSVQNGADGEGDRSGVVARAEYKIGEGAKQREGALDNTGLNATFGLGYFSDNSQIMGSDFGSALALDAYVDIDALSLQAEILDCDDEFASRALGNTTDDATPFDATAGYLLGDSRFEGFVRYQDLDNEVDASLIGAGVNYYVNGHALKWQANVSHYDDDNEDGTIFQVGLSIGLSEPK